MEFIQLEVTLDENIYRVRSAKNLNIIKKKAMANENKVNWEVVRSKGKELEVMPEKRHEIV